MDAQEEEEFFVTAGVVLDYRCLNGHPVSVPRDSAIPPAVDCPVCGAESFIERRNDEHAGVAFRGLELRSGCRDRMVVEAEAEAILRELVDLLPASAPLRRPAFELAQALSLRSDQDVLEREIAAARCCGQVRLVPALPDPIDRRSHLAGG